MADKSKIEWTEATWNPVNGCSLASPGCTNCYAMKQAHRFPPRQGLTVRTKGGMVWTGEVRFNERVLDQPLRWKRPRRIFVCAHGDLFHESVPDVWIDQVFAVMALCPQHQFQVLTKRADRMREYLERDEWGVTCRIDAEMDRIVSERVDPLNRRSDDLRATAIDLDETWPIPNVWLGVSVEDQARADERIPDLLATPAAVRWLSCEPLLGPLDLWNLGVPYECKHEDAYTEWDTNALVCSECEETAYLDWIVVGGESGPGSRPMHPDWARSLRDQCQAASVPFFFKQWGSHRPTSDANGEYMIPASKAEAGRLLDGVEHNGMPAVRHGG